MNYYIHKDYLKFDARGSVDSFQQVKSGQRLKSGCRKGDISRSQEVGQ